MSARTRKFRGIGASPGVAIGRVYLVDRRAARFRRFHVESDEVPRELERLEVAVRRSVEQLADVRDRLVESSHEHDAILEAHEMMLRDQTFVDEALGLIRSEMVNAEWAVAKVIRRLSAAFDRLADPYFKERRSDIDFVRDRLIRNLTGQAADLSEIESLGEGTVLIAHDLSPVDVALLSRQRVTAFVTEAGGKASHTAIIARSMDVPAIVGARGILDQAGSGDLVIVDGAQGQATLRPTKRALDDARKRANRYRQTALELIEAQSLPATSLDGVTIRVSGNIELPSEIDLVLERGGEGIGLYRTEFLFLARHTIPDEGEHYRTYYQVLEQVGDRPVTVRTLDVGGDKLFGTLAHEHEANPAMGLRAIRYCLKHRDIFEPQLAGLMRAATHGNPRLMIPMVTSIDEVREVHRMLDDVSARLTHEGKEHRRDIPVGIMVEVPSAALLTATLAKEVDFLSIGTNDLLQFLLAVDRGNESVDYLYDGLHPAALRILSMVCDAAHAANKPISLCGEVAGEIEFAPLALALGFREISMNAGSIPRIKRILRELTRTDAVGLLEEVQTLESPKAVRSAIHEFLESKWLGRRLEG